MPPTSPKAFGALLPLESVLALAVSQAASAIFFEEDGGEVRVRFRVEDALQPRLELRLPLELLAELRSACGLSAQRELLAEGALDATVGDESLRFRATWLPGAGGAVLGLHRLLRVPADLTDAGLPDAARAEVDDALSRSSGLTLFCGATRMGKTSSFYAALRSIASRGRVVATVEAPVEAVLSGVHQVDLSSSAERNPGAALRALERFGADVIGLGEIRDERDAGALTQCTQAGRTTAATLACGDSFSAISRLLNLGVEPFLLTRILRLVVAQRRVVTARGPTLLVETLRLTPELADLLLRGASMDELRTAAVCEGMRPFGHQARELVRRGAWTEAELAREELPGASSS